MKVAITGSSGLIGTALVSFLTSQGLEVLKLVRSAPKQANEVFWDVHSGNIDLEKIEGLDALIHLAGENIANGRWTPRKKKKIYESRVQGTRLLSKSLISLASPPRCVITASATNYYGNQEDELLTEESAKGSGFLSDVCKAWEDATSPLHDKGVRVVNIRIGMVLSTQWGILARMLPTFKLGGGGNLGDGQQYMSWVTLEDLVGIIDHIIRYDTISGPLNAVTPNPVRNAEFTKVLGAILHRPTSAMFPAAGIRFAMGEMGEALLLSSSRVQPQVLEQTGYQFQYPAIESALRHCLEKLSVSLEASA